MNMKDPWVAETPSKSSPKTQVMVDVAVDADADVGGSSHAKSFFDGLDGKNQISDTNTFPQCGDMNINNQGEPNMFTAPSSSKKRRNDQSHERAKKKVYRPKVLRDESKTKTKTKTKTKRTFKSQANNSMNTPKPSTPKQRKSVLRRRNPSCQYPLFVEDEDAVSFPFSGELKGYKLVEQGKFVNSNSTLQKNDSGVRYNSLKTYGNIRSLSRPCLDERRQVGVNFPKTSMKKKGNGGRRPQLPWTCLVESRLAGANFPENYKKKRINRGKPLEKLSTPLITKGKRSKSFIRKKRQQMGPLIDIIQHFKKKRGQKVQNELAIFKESGDGQLAPYNNKEHHPDRKDCKVDVDKETLKVWKLLMDGKEHEEKDDKKRKYWEDQRKLYRENVEEFMFRMHLILGDRRFLPWKGSVMDSVIGAYLTQNVSDHLSSSAFMSLASKFPINTTRSVSVGSNVVFPIPKFDDDDKEMEEVKVEEVEGAKLKNISRVDNNGTENDFSLTKIEPDHPSMISEKKKSIVRNKNMNKQEREMLSEVAKKEKQDHWDRLRKIHSKSTRHSDHEDSVDWEAVRCAESCEVAEAIVGRGQQNMISERVQSLLNHLKDLYGDLDLEWLRYAPPNETKEYLLNRGGLGLKSVECIRLLSLQHRAFPVDVNVGRIAVRLGWVPLQPLPETIQIHDLEDAKPAIHDKTPTNDEMPETSVHPINSFEHQVDKELEPIIEMPASPEDESAALNEFQVNINDEEYKDDDSDEILSLKLGSVEDSKNNTNMSTAATTLVALSADSANIPMPKLKNVSRLRTERLVYVLTDDHPLLVEHAPREPDDPSPYLLVIWTTGELDNSLEEEDSTLTVPGTLLIPCRTAMRGRFPLNGTYFQVNEVFADYESSEHPINVPRKWLWNLEKRVTYFGTGISPIMKAIDAKTKAPRPLSKRFHRSTKSKQGKKNNTVLVNENESGQMKVNL
ncbi:hypothetical protein RIF29_27556 [Crotalaria pallida]|uniref:Demeter RRM-fold domain-containing protein n=1 Tax=Crotalaria pallida TaxID=3830 RepID=A0AAN9I151_CROPI